METVQVILCIQCTGVDGKRGTFYRSLDGIQLSPTCRDCVELFEWNDANGKVYKHIN